MGISERRQADVTPLIERRGGTEQSAPEPREARWLTWTRQNENRGKSLDERAA